VTIKLTPESCRAARAILNMSTHEMATAVGVSPTTLNGIEAGNTVRASTEAKIIRGLNSLGVEILNSDAPGARMLPRPVSE
jgi:DNA-binding XRE family transcriptional regulator